MAYSKIILNGDTLMDVTGDTVDAGKLLYGETATKNSGSKVTGNIASKSSSDLTASGATVTAPAGYYGSSASKSVSTTTHPNPTAAIASSTGVVTATHTQTTGYVTSGTTTDTLNLTTKAAATINTSTTDQTISSYRWLTGTQTIKSVTTTNLTAANIASGVTVKVGDANNASRITQVTGTYSPTTSALTVTPTETSQTFNATGVYGYKPVTVNAISSTYVGTGVAKKSSTDTTFASTTGTFTAPVGYYSTAATKTITTQAAQTIYPSTATQYINSYRWLTGSQTIASVTTTNLTASNIAEGVVVKVGDANNASRITQVTGTHSGGGGDGISIDDIAKRAISGNISGSAAYIGSYAFCECDSLLSANFPNTSLIGYYAFYGCNFLSTIVASSATQIGSNAFHNCTKLTVVDIPNLASIANTAFSNCYDLSSAYFSKVEYIGGSAFCNCSGLTTASFPLVSNIGTYAFTSCRKLKDITLSSITYINTYAFNRCYNLLSVYLLGSSVPTLANINAFTSTPISNYTTSTGGIYGSIFVPSSLYNSYITATNWSAYAARIVSV